MMFAAIGILTGTSVYLFVSETSQQAAEDRASEIALGRAITIANELGDYPIRARKQILAKYRSDAFAAWVFNRDDELKTQRTNKLADETLGPGNPPSQRRARDRPARASST